MLTTYVIHLDRSTDRKPIINALEKRLPNVVLSQAVDGSTLSGTERAKLVATHPKDPTYPFDLMSSEIGCFMSHRTVWERIATSDAPFALVAEDDLALDDGFEDSLDLALTHMREDRLIRFPMRDRETPDTMVAQANGISLFRPQVIGLTASLYICGRAAARTLLEASRRIDRPVDTWLQMRWDTQVDSLTLWPSHIHSAAAAHGGSTIQAKKSVWAELSRGWKRYQYRAAIAKQSNIT